MQVRSELYIVCQYFCSMSIFLPPPLKRKMGLFENQVKQGLTGYTQTYIKFANTSIPNLRLLIALTVKFCCQNWNCMESGEYFGCC